MQAGTPIIWVRERFANLFLLGTRLVACNKHLIVLFLLFLLSCLTYSAQIYAQDNIQVPSSVDPGQLQREFQSTDEPGSVPPMAVPAPPKLARPDNAEQIQFVLNDVQFDGNTLYSDDALQADFAELIGENVSLEQLYAMADVITAKYRNDGYVLSQVVVPAQQITKAGIVKLRVIEGSVHRVEFRGFKPGDKDILRAYADGIVAAKPLTTDRLEHYMLLMNDLPGISAVSAITRADDGPVGTALLIVTAKYDRYSGTLSLDNRGNQRVGPARVDANVDINLKDNRHSKLSARGIVTTDTEELGLINLGYDTALGRDGLRLQLGASYLKSEPGLQGPLTDFESEATTLTVTIKNPIYRSRLSNAYLDFTFKAYDASTESIQSGINTEDKTRQLQIGLTVDTVDGFNGVNQMSIRLAKGLGGLGASDEGVQESGPQLSRSNANVDFIKTEFYLARLQKISDYGWSLLAAISAQDTGDELLSSERFGIGGAGFVRAYDGSEVTGDKGVAGKLELRYSGLSFNEQRVRTLPYVFYDIGLVKNNQDNEQADVNSETTLRAAGAGVRISAGKLGGYLEVGKPLADDVGSEGNTDARLFAGISYNF